MFKSTSHLWVANSASHYRLKSNILYCYSNSLMCFTLLIWAKVWDAGWLVIIHDQNCFPYVCCDVYLNLSPGLLYISLDVVSFIWQWVNLRITYQIKKAYFKKIKKFLLWWPAQRNPSSKRVTLKLMPWFTTYFSTQVSVTAANETLNHSTSISIETLHPILSKMKRIKSNCGRTQILKSSTWLIPKQLKQKLKSHQTVSVSKNISTV